ncbi:MAG: hypothetical protein ACLUFV_07935 [Acutalibacteraceae bacterium]
MKRLQALLLALWLLTGAAAAYDGTEAVFSRFPLDELAAYAGTSEADCWLQRSQSAARRALPYTPTR